MEGAISKRFGEFCKRWLFSSGKADKDSSDDPGVFGEWTAFLKIGCLGFGGPMAVFSLLRDELVERKKIITDEDFLEGAVLGDVLPGPVTMDIVSYTGFKMKKWTGAFIATAVFILPSFVLMIILAELYNTYNVTPRIESMFKCLGAAVTGLIVSVGMSLGEREVRDYGTTSILIWAFASALVFRLDIVTIVGLAGLAGILLGLDSEDSTA